MSLHMVKVLATAKSTIDFFWYNFLNFIVDMSLYARTKKCRVFPLAVGKMAQSNIIFSNHKTHFLDTVFRIIMKTRFPASLPINRY